MCGIFAYIGPRPPQETLMEGLKKLEYRGYDSSGMAFFEGEKIQSIKALGDISRLQERVQKNSFNDETNTLKKINPPASLGMGHTRWATHGPPTEENAHPHQGGPIYVIHNGVIENEQSLREMLSGIKFQSQTDSELIAHLIHFYYQKEGNDFLTAVLRAKEFLKGSYAVVTICEKEPGTLIAFKNGPPLMLCRGEKELFLSSDPHAVSGQANQILFLEDGDTLFLKGNKWSVFNQKKKEVKRTFSKLNLKENLSEKKGYPHFMLKEIFEQPQVIRTAISSHTKNKQFYFSKDNNKTPKAFQNLVLDTKEIIIIACGSSYHAGLYGRHIIESLSNVKVSVEIASEFIYRDPVILPHTTLLFISQSGETADTLSALKWGKKKGIHSISLCNVQNSTLDRLSDYSLFMNAGQEIGVASTKSFMASLMHLTLFAFELAQLKNKLSQEEETILLNHLLSLPSYMEKVLGYDKFFLVKTEKLKKFKGFFYLGRGPYHPIALEGALKLKEIAYTHAEGYPAGEMKHGPLALIDENMVVVALIPTAGSKLYEKTLVNLKEAKSRGAFLIAVGGGEETDSLCDYHLPLPETHSFFHPLLSIVPLQMMAYFISRGLGYNADKPRNLAKSVTVE